MNASRLAMVTAAIGGTLILATPASAGTGCNGVINPFVWGCAPWDNNNGPKYPYYRKQNINIPKASAKVETVNGAQMVTDLRNNQRYPMIGNAGGTIVAAGSLN